MPNWCSSTITLSFATPEHLDSFLSQAHIDKDTGLYLSNEDMTDLFDKFLPTPPETLSSQAWYDWRLDHWGCKWNPIIDSVTADVPSLSITLELQTPGHPPISFFSNLIRLFPGSSAHIQYTDLNMNIFGDQFLK